MTPAQLTAAGWTCIHPHLFPALLLCAPPGKGMPPLPGTPGFADRAPSYELLVFESATGAFLAAQSSGFAWGDAGIGAGGMLAVTVIGIGGALTLTRRRNQHIHD